MIDKLLTRVKVFIPGYNFYPLSLAVKWLKGYYNRVVYTNEARKEAIPDLKTFRRKLAKPLLKVFPQFLNPQFVNKSGLDANDIIVKHTAGLKSPLAAKKYQKHAEMKYATKYGIPAEQIKAKLPLSAVYYTEKMSFGPWVLAGPLNPKPDHLAIKPYTGKSALSIIVGWFSGDVLIPEYLRSQDDLITGQPCLITRPSKLRKFQMELQTRLRRAVSHIQTANYAPEVVRQENDRTNQLVDSYRKPDIVSFQTDGPSHLHFIVHPQTAELRNGLKITTLRNQISQYFLGKDAKPIEPVFLPEGQKSADFIGKYGHSILVDMYLDLQVTIK